MKNCSLRLTVLEVLVQDWVDPLIWAQSGNSNDEECVGEQIVDHIARKQREKGRGLKA